MELAVTVRSQGTDVLKYVNSLLFCIYGPLFYLQWKRKDYRSRSLKISIQRFSGPGQNRSDWTGLDRFWPGLAWTEGFGPVQAFCNDRQASPGQLELIGPTSPDRARPKPVQSSPVGPNWTESKCLGISMWIFPHLTNMARDVYAVPATSCGVERYLVILSVNATTDCL